MKTVIMIFAFATLASVMTGCGKDPSRIDGNITDAAESGMNSIAAIADDQANSSLANLSLTRSQKAVAFLEGIVLPQNAWGATCLSMGRAAGQSCSSGVRAIDYSIGGVSEAAAQLARELSPAPSASPTPIPAPVS
jgi:hypothetical protein